MKAQAARSEKIGIVLTNEEFDNFLKAVDNPPKATRALRELLKNIKEKNETY